MTMILNAVECLNNDTSQKRFVWEVLFIVVCFLKCAYKDALENNCKIILQTLNAPCARFITKALENNQITCIAHVALLKCIPLDFGGEMRIFLA